MKMWRRTLALAGVVLLAGACVTPADELRGLADQPPLDCSVLLTGGAFLTGASLADGTFSDDTASAGAAHEAIAIDAFVDVLQRGRVFQRVTVDEDPVRRTTMSRLLAARATDDTLAALLARARADGHDYLLVIEELKDGVIENQGTNGRWPVTFATWLLLGVGALIPDRTFESRATLRVTLRELQTGRELYDPPLVTVPVDLSLVERTDFWGLLSSVLVPPFWVGDDRLAVRAAVRATTQRRLLLQLARELKSESLRQRLRERVPADVTLVPVGDTFRVVVWSAESLGVVHVRGDGIEASQAEAWERALLASGRVDEGRWHYEVDLPATIAGNRVQVAVGTLRGGIASATFRPELRR